MNLRSFYKLSIITFIAFTAAVSTWVLTPEYSIGSFFGERLFPELMEKINDTEVVSIEHTGETLTFIRDENGDWTLMEANEYPADKERIRNVLIGLSQLEKIEPKTALPEFYQDLNVEDSSATSKSYLVTLLNAEGQQLISLLIGKNTSGVTWNGQGYFVRSPNDAQSWLVRGNADVTGGKLSWLPTRILPLEKGRISSVTIVDGTRTREVVYKRTSPKASLAPFFLSDRFFIITDDFIKNMEKTLTSFDFKEVIKRPEKLAEEIPFSSIMIETADGLNIFMFLYLTDSKPYVAVSFDIGDNASEKVKAEAVSLERLHSKWLYLMSNEKITPLLPFLSVPEKETPKKELKKQKTSKAAETTTSTKKKSSVKKKQVK